MNFIPKKKTLWVADENTEYMTPDYVPLSSSLNIIIYITYIVLWLSCLRLFKMFNNKYEFVPLLSAFLIGGALLFLLDWVNIHSWGITVNKVNSKYYILNTNSFLPGSLESQRVMKSNNTYKMDNPNEILLLVDKDKYSAFLKDKKITDIPFSQWRAKKYVTKQSSSEKDLLASAKRIIPQINLLMNCAYYVFTILITLSAVAFRIKKTLFSEIIPWVLSSAMVGLGSMFIMIWGRDYRELLFQLGLKKKLLITSISFALAACFTFISKLRTKIHLIKYI